MFESLNHLNLNSNEFVYRVLDNPKNNDAIVIFNPNDAFITTPTFIRSTKTITEHINHIRKENIKKAIIIANNIDFITECPSLEYLWIIPSNNADNFDYTPVYNLPNLKWLQCNTIYGPHENKVACIDYSRFRNLRRLLVSGISGNINVDKSTNIRTLLLTDGYPHYHSLISCIPHDNLINLDISLSRISSLDGIENALKLRRLVLAYNRNLHDISALAAINNTLGYLEIDTCNKITDYSVLSYMHNLEHLSLRSSNSIPDISFINNMPKLKSLCLFINVKDGDLSACKQIPYVKIQDKRHYTCKDRDMPKSHLNLETIYPSDIL